MAIKFRPLNKHAVPPRTRHTSGNSRDRSFTERWGTPQAVSEIHPFIPDLDAARTIRSIPDLRVLPILVGVWGSMFVMVMYRPGLSVVVSVFLGGVVILVGSWMIGATNSVQRSVRVWLTACLGAALCGIVRVWPLLSHADRHWLNSYMGQSVAISPEAPLRVNGYPQRLNDSAVDVDNPIRYGVRVTTQGIDADIFLISDSRLAHAIPGDSATGLFTVVSNSRPGISPVLLVHKSAAPFEVKPDHSTWAGLCQEMREQFSISIGRFTTPEIAGLLRGMIIGDTSGMPLADKHAFLLSGLSHITAVSGANLSIIVATVLFLTRHLDRSTRLGLAAVVLFTFVTIVGADPSVLRAASASFLALGALLFRRYRNSVASLCVGATAILMWDPSLAVNLGFILSCAATASIIVITPYFYRTIENIVNKSGANLGRFFVPVATAVSMTVAAELATMPILALAVGYIGLASFAANLAAAVCLTPITIVGTVCLFVAALLAVGKSVALYLAAVSSQNEESLFEASQASQGFPGDLVSTLLYACEVALHFLIGVGGWIVSPLAWWIRGVGYWGSEQRYAQVFIASPAHGVALIVSVIIGLGCMYMWIRQRNHYLCITIAMCFIAETLTLLSSPSLEDRMDPKYEPVASDALFGNAPSENQEKADLISSLHASVHPNHWPPQHWRMGACLVEPSAAVIVTPTAQYALLTRDPTRNKEAYKPHIAQCLQSFGLNPSKDGASDVFQVPREENSGEFTSQSEVKITNSHGEEMAITLVKSKGEAADRDIPTPQNQSSLTQPKKSEEFVIGHDQSPERSPQKNPSAWVLIVGGANTGNTKTSAPKYTKNSARSTRPMSLKDGTPVSDLTKNKVVALDNSLHECPQPG